MEVKVRKFTKPNKLQKGDCIATISLSYGAAGEKNMLWRYNLAKERLKKDFGLNVIETPHSHKGKDFIYKNPQARASDLMEALQNSKIKAIFLNQGGDDGIRILPFIDFDIIKTNPKIFLGYSDGSTFHNMFFKAGIVSFYGPNVLTTISEPVILHDYTKKWLKKVLFSNEIIGMIEPTREWTAEPRDWSSTIEKKRKMNPNNGYEVLQGNGKICGHIVGGCIGPMQAMKGTCIFPPLEDWKNSIIFLEGGIPYDQELALIHMLRSLAATGMFRKANGIVFSKIPAFSEKVKRIILKIIHDEEGLIDLPILFNIDCGHTAPMTIIPFGVNVEIDCDNCTFTILESGVV